MQWWVLESDQPYWLNFLLLVFEDCCHENCPMKVAGSAHCDAMAQTDLTSINLPTYATSVLLQSALVKEPLVLLGCSLFVAKLLLAKPDRGWLAGA